MKDFNEFEDQLRESLRRVEPPAGLEQRIVARVEARTQARSRFARRRWLAVAASVALAVSAGGYGLHWRQEQMRERQAEEARQKLILALRVTTQQVSRVEEQLRAIGVQRIDVTEVTQ
jgi:thiamine monophosphate synthase